MPQTTNSGIDLADVGALGAELLRLQRRRTTAVAGTELDTSAFRLLWVLSDGRARTQRELAEELDLERSTITRQVRAALRAGLLEQRAVEHGPGRELRPTPAGRAAYERDAGTRAAAIATALADLGPDRAGRLIADLTDFNDAWDAARG